MRSHEETEQVAAEERSPVNRGKQDHLVPPSGHPPQCAVLKWVVRQERWKRKEMILVSTRFKLKWKQEKRRGMISWLLFNGESENLLKKAGNCTGCV